MLVPIPKQKRVHDLYADGVGRNAIAKDTGLTVGKVRDLIAQYNGHKLGLEDTPWLTKRTSMSPLPEPRSDQERQRFKLVLEQRKAMVRSKSIRPGGDAEGTPGIRQYSRFLEPLG